MSGPLNRISTAPGRDSVLLGACQKFQSRDAGRFRCHTISAIATTCVHLSILAVVFISSQFTGEEIEEVVPGGGARVIDLVTIPVLTPGPPPSPQPPPQHEPPRPEPTKQSEPPRLASIELPVWSLETPTSPIGTLQESVGETTLVGEPGPGTVQEVGDFVSPTQPGQAAAPTQGEAVGPGSGPGDAVPTWEGMLVAALERQKRYPMASQRRREEDVVYVRLSLDREGRVTMLTIQKSRGYAALDAEALDLIRRASPLPKPPDSVVGEQITLVVPIEFYIPRARR